MGERHIQQDFVSCDRCGKEVEGTRCSSKTDIERMYLGNVHIDSVVVRFTGLKLGDLCMDCRVQIAEHIKLLLPPSTEYVEDERIDDD